MKGVFGLSTILFLASIATSSNIWAVDLQLFKDAVPAKPIASIQKPYHRENHEKWKALHPFLETLFCGIKFYDSGKKYKLKTFTSMKILQKESYQLTHKGACGVCSSLQDLAVYLEKPDLTSPVRWCGSLSMVPSASKSCLKKLGFSNACSQIWNDNILHTRKNCKWVCLKSWMSKKPFNKPDGSLNSCLQCDEDHSGPVFKAVAGRTRRNSGIISAIGRNPAEVYPISHNYVLK